MTFSERCTRVIPLFALVSLLMVGGAWFTQLVWGWEPCPLCLIQRNPHYVVLAATVFALLFWFQGWRLLLVLATLVMVGMFGEAAYWAAFHTGVEMGWWKGLAACSATSTDAISGADLLGKAVRNCAVPTYLMPNIIPGLTMAMAHFLVVVVTLVLALVMLFAPTGNRMGRSKTYGVPE